MAVDPEPDPGRADADEFVVDDDTFLNDFADRLILGGAWTWADHDIGTAQ